MFITEQDREIQRHYSRVARTHTTTKIYCPLRYLPGYRPLSTPGNYKPIKTDVCIERTTIRYTYRIELVYDTHAHIRAIPLQCFNSQEAERRYEEVTPGEILDLMTNYPRVLSYDWHMYVYYPEGGGAFYQVYKRDNEKFYKYCDQYSELKCHDIVFDDDIDWDKHGLMESDAWVHQFGKPLFVVNTAYLEELAHRHDNPPRNVAVWDLCRFIDNKYKSGDYSNVG